MYQVIDNVRVWGEPLESAVSQAITCSKHGNVVQTLLMADHHKGYSQPVGGVVVYDGQVSPSGVGYDIACGNKAVRTNLKYEDVQHNISGIMDEIAKNISFGLGRNNNERVDHELFDDPDWDVYKQIGIHEHDSLKALARKQLGTVGSGNHFVDIFVEEKTGDIWVANHFGSRGFGHKTASGFLNLANGRNFSDKAPGESMDQPPTLIDLNSELGDMYFRAMKLAGRYAYAGRDYVMTQVLNILGAVSTFEVHNHHNFAWKEAHNGREYIVVRKGATPSAPGQLGFIGGSMADISVIVKGKDSQENKDAYYSTVHGAGRMMSRTEAAGKMNWKTRRRRGGKITPQQMKEAIEAYGVELRGAGTDESPFVYKKLRTVLNAHSETIEILHELRPIGVCMAGANEFDPYKD
ncbi:RNA-splicing ligase RtcB [Bacillus sp. VT-16-64]|nr:RNA-splicing ligase RtcB [Bacillus sp. VT-16-64]